MVASSRLAEKVKAAADRMRGWMKGGECQMRIGSLSSRLVSLNDVVLYAQAAKVNDPSTPQVIPRLWLSRSEEIYREPGKGMRNIAKHDPGRARQKS